MVHITAVLRPCQALWLRPGVGRTPGISCEAPPPISPPPGFVSSPLLNQSRYAAEVPGRDAPLHRPRRRARPRRLAVDPDVETILPPRQKPPEALSREAPLQARASPSLGGDPRRPRRESRPPAPHAQDVGATAPVRLDGSIRPARPPRPPPLRPAMTDSECRFLRRVAEVNPPTTAGPENPESLADARGLGSTAPIHNRSPRHSVSYPHSFAAVDRRLFVRPPRLLGTARFRERLGTAATTARSCVLTAFELGKAIATSGSRTTATVRPLSRAA